MDNYYDVEDNTAPSREALRLNCMGCTAILGLAVGGGAAVASSLSLGAIIGIMLGGIVGGAVVGYGLATCFWGSGQAAPAPATSSAYNLL